MVLDLMVLVCRLRFSSLSIFIPRYLAAGLGFNLWIFMDKLNLINNAMFMDKFHCFMFIERSFTRMSSILSNLFVVVGDKPVFQCELCPTTCGRKTDLRIHVQKLHTSDKPLKCKRCGKTFPDR